MARKVLVVNVLSGVGAEIVTALAALWAIPQLLLTIGAAGYGTYAVAATVVGYFSIADMGLSNATLQRLARARATEDMEAFGETVGSSAFMLGSVGLVLATTLLVFGTPIGQILAGSAATEAQRSTVVSAIHLCAIGALPTMLRPVLEAIIAASELLTRSYVVSTIANLTRTVGAVFAAWVWPTAIAPVAVMVCASVLQFIVLIPVARFSVPALRTRTLRVTRSELRALLQLSMPLWLSSGTGMLANQIDRLVVSSWFGLSAVGLYAVAQSLAGRILVVPYAIGRAYFPRMARELAHEAPEQHARTIRGYNAAAVMATAVVAVPLAMMGYSVLCAWTGRTDLDEAPIVLAYLLAGTVANSMCVAPLAVLQVKLQFRAQSMPFVIVLVLHAIGCAILPRFLGMPGTALSWGLGQATAAILFHTSMRVRYRVPLVGDIARLLAVAGFMGILMLGVARRFQLSPVDVHLSAIRRLAPVLAQVGAWSALGAGVAVAALFVGRARDIRAVLGLPPRA